MRCYNSDNQLIKLREHPFGRGGEGSVYEIADPDQYHTQVAKIYHPRERNKHRELKINYLRQNRPAEHSKLSTIWVENMLYQEEAFVGFTMAKAPGALDLSTLCSLRMPAKTDQLYQERYARYQKRGLMHRMELCYQIAQAVQSIHASGKYVLVDLKPENIKVSLSGQISILDIDSIEVIEKGQLLFPAEKVSPEYAPPEMNHLDLPRQLIPPQWDYFSMAVVFYKLLLGLHPFTATPKARHQHLCSLEQKIQAGFFPHGSRRGYLEVIPAPHQNFYALPTGVQALFSRCFDDGLLDSAQRPSPEEWGSALLEAQQRPHLSSFQQAYQALPPTHRLGIQSKTREKEELKRGFQDRALLASVVMLLFIVIGLRSLHYFAQGFRDSSKREHYQSFFVDPTGENRYDWIEVSESTPRSGLAKVFVGGKYGFVNAHGEEIIPPDFDAVGNFFPTTNPNAERTNQTVYLVKVKRESHYGLMNARGEMIYPIVCDSIGAFEQSRAFFYQKGKVGLLRTDGKALLPPVYEEILPFSGGKARFLLEGKFGMIDRNGQEIIPPEYEVLDDLQEGLALAKKSGLYGYINQENRVLIPFQYKMALPFQEGKAAVKKESFFGYIDKQGQVRIPFVFQRAESFQQGKAAVTFLHRNFYIDTQGNCLQNCSNRPAKDIEKN